MPVDRVGVKVSAALRRRDRPRSADLRAHRRDRGFERLTRRVALRPDIGQLPSRAVGADRERGERPTQARCNASSPFRNRWARTPPVARPLAGNSANSLTFALPGSVPSRVSLPAATVTTTAASASTRGTLVKWMAWAPLPRLTPAIPPAGHPCGRTEAAGNRNSCAVGGDEHEFVGLVALHDADDLVAGLQADDLEFGLVRIRADGDALDDALLGAERDRTVASRARRSRAPSRRGWAARGNRATRTPAPSCTEVGGSIGRSTGVNRMSRPRLVTAPISARLVVSSIDRMASCLLRRAGFVMRRRAVGAVGQVDAGDAARDREEHAARHIGHLERGGGSPLGRGSGDRRTRVGQQRASRRAEALGDLGELVGDEGLDAVAAGEQRLEFVDLGAQLVAFGLELDA